MSTRILGAARFELRRIAELDQLAERTQQPLLEATDRVSDWLRPMLLHPNWGEQLTEARRTPGRWVLPALGGLRALTDQTQALDRARIAEVAAFFPSPDARLLDLLQEPHPLDSWPTTSVPEPQDPFADAPGGESAQTISRHLERITVYAEAVRGNPQATRLMAAELGDFLEFIGGNLDASHRAGVQTVRGLEQQIQQQEGWIRQLTTALQDPAIQDQRTAIDERISQAQNRANDLEAHFQTELDRALAELSPREGDPDSPNAPMEGDADSGVFVDLDSSSGLAQGEIYGPPGLAGDLAGLGAGLLGNDSDADSAVSGELASSLELSSLDLDFA
ncbi:MAG: hypothetical protein ACRC0L_06255, partial [Angustibacter sp.]